MPDEPQPGPDDDFQEMLRKLLAGEGQIDPSQLAGAAGLPNDPAFVANLMSQLQQAAQNGGDGIDFSVTSERAAAIAADGSHGVDPATSQASDQAFQVAALWLDEVTTVAELTATPSLYTREQWAKATAPVWTQIAEPVAASIADALTEAIDQRAPEELKAMLGDVSKAMRGVGGALFAIQLGQVVGQLSKEVVSGGDVGVPLLDEQVAALLPQNVAEFALGLDVPEDEVRIYLAVRELAHARLFRSARWLRLHIISSITEYARGIHIPFDRVEELAADIDPTDQEQLRDALASGALIPPRTPEQDAALARLETMLALGRGLGRHGDRGCDGTTPPRRCHRRDRATPSRCRGSRRVGVRDARRPGTPPAPPARGRRHVAAGHRRTRLRTARRPVGSVRPGPGQ